MRRSLGFSVVVESVAWATGIFLLTLCALTYFEGLAGHRQAMQNFAALQGTVRQEAMTDESRLWSEERIDASRSTPNLSSRAPLAVLRIPRIDLEVPVLNGTDAVTLNRAVGHIAETAIPGTQGNSGIAGHRDGYFRGLKNIVAGDTIELDTLQGKETYQVDRIWIVKPNDVWVLDPTRERSLTLVTCYPFYFVGPAPDRYIVRATLRSVVPPSAGGPTRSRREEQQAPVRP